MRRLILSHHKTRKRKVDQPVSTVIAGQLIRYVAGDHRADTVAFANTHGEHVIVLTGYGTPIARFRCSLSPQPRDFTVHWLYCHSPTEYSFTATTDYGRPFTGELRFATATPLEVVIHPPKVD